MSHRTFWFAVACIAAVSLPSAACNKEASGPLETGPLAVYMFTDYLPPGVLADFEAASGVKVTLTAYETNEELQASLAAHPTAYDVVVPSDYMVEILVRQGALRPLDLANIPHYSNIDPAFLAPYFDPGGVGSRARMNKAKYSLPYLWGTTGIAYDRSKVSPPPKRWSDLWRPDLGGKLVVLDDAREMMGIGLLVTGHGKNSTKAADLDAAQAKLMALAPAFAVVDANTGEKALLDGRAVAGVVFSGNAELAHRGNPNIEWVVPEDGPGIWFDNLAIPTGAPHPRAAEAFLNFVLSAEVGAKVAAGYPYSNPNLQAINWLHDHDRAAWETYRHRPTTSPSAAALAKAHIVKDVGPLVSKRFEDAWNAVKAARGLQ